jgi:hypothetical protein
MSPGVNKMFSRIGNAASQVEPSLTFAQPWQAMIGRMVWREFAAAPSRDKQPPEVLREPGIVKSLNH